MGRFIGPFPQVVRGWVRGAGADACNRRSFVLTCDKKELQTPATKVSPQDYQTMMLTVYLELDTPRLNSTRSVRLEWSDMGWRSVPV